MDAADYDVTENLRVLDLVAKVAGVNLRQTARVLIAADLVAWYTGRQDVADLLMDGIDPDRPGPEQVAACEQNYFELMQQIKAFPEINNWYRRLKDLK